jgi:hypothetical protein
MGLRFETSTFPVVVVRFPARCRGDDVDVLLQGLDALVERGERYVMITDVSGMAEPMPPELRARIDDHIRLRRDELGRLSTGNAIVSSSPQMRGVLAAYYRSREPATEHQVVATFDEAVAWARQRVDADGAIPGPRRPPSEDDGGGSDAVGIDLASLEAIVDLFDSPAFVVSADGEVRGQNAAARKRFPCPPRWLSRAVSPEPGPVGPLCRIAVARGPDGLWNIVVPDSSLLPPVELSKPASALPASLRPIADLLAQGMSDKEIAAELDMALSTVRTYVARAFKKLDVHSRAELIAMWASR